MKYFVVKFTTILLLLSFVTITIKAQVLLPSTEDRPERREAYLDKIDFLSIIKTEIELKQNRTQQDTLPTQERKLTAQSKGLQPRPKKKAIDKIPKEQ